MKSRWEAIESWFAENNSEVLSTFNPGAMPQAIESFEKHVGTTLPDNFKELYAVHDGQDSGLVFNSAIMEPESEGLMPLERILHEWNLFTSLNAEYPTKVKSKDAERGIKPLYWNPLWIPLVGDGMGNVYCLDLDPGKDGTYGQIIFRDHEGPIYEMVAASLEEWIDSYIDECLE